MPIIAPMETLKPKSTWPSSAPTSASGSDTMMVKGCLKDSNWIASTM